MSIRVILLALLFFSTASYADEYRVQIGALLHADPAKMQIPPGVGELRSEPGPSGLTRFVVGPFAGRAEAERALEVLRAGGYPDAFIRPSAAQSTTPGHQATIATSAQPTDAGSEKESLSQADIDALLSLSAEEREGLVYLDGRLHKKVGDRFIPFRD